MATIDDIGGPTDPANDPSVSAWAEAVRTYLLDLRADLDAASAIPAGGDTGEVLAKASATDFDTEWVAPSGGGGGTRTVKAKTSGNTTITTTLTQIGESITVAAAAGDEFWLSIDGTVENQNASWGSSFELHITSGTPRQLGGTMQPNQVFCAVTSRIPVTIQASDITAGEVVFQVKASAGANRTLRSNTTSPFYFCLEPA